MSPKIEFPQFLTNLPTGTDLFESGSQNKTAKSISEHIKSKSKNFRLIGLDGYWGSGKSNVISIVNKTLGADYYLFIYDAWSHQEDLQRRSFLEELTDDLQKTKILEDVWKDKLNDLLSKKKESITKTIPKLSYPIIVSILVAILLPITKTLSDLTTCAFYKFLFALSPIIIALIIWAIAALRNQKYRSLSNLFYIYKEADLQQTIHETISEKEPSVREFRNWMKDLSADLKKEVIIVFDNMDRLPTEKVQVLWSSIHTFFSEDYYPRIWVIVPFDREHIKKAFDDDQEKSNHFINKTFSVIFNVSPPVLTDWKGFFRKKYLEALGLREDGEYNIVKNIFDLYELHITPRKIIAFINDLVSLKLIWKDEIMLRYMALFILNREQILNEPLSEILNQTYLHKGKALFQADENVSDNIAALVYNVDLKIASEVTLYRQIEISLRSKDLGLITELEKHGSFYAVLEKVITKEEIDIESSAITLQAINKEQGLEQNLVVMRDIWNNLARKRMEFDLGHQNFSEDLQVLLLKSSNSYKKSFVIFILTQFAKLQEFKGSVYYKSLNALDDFIKEQSIDIDISGLIKKKIVSPEIFLDYLKEAKKEYGKYQVSVNNLDLDNYFLDKIANDLHDSDLLFYINQSYKFPNSKNKIEELIGSNQITLENLEQIFIFYRATSLTQRATQKIDDVTISNLLNSAALGSMASYELVSMRLARVDKFPGYDGIADSIVQETNAELVKEVAERIEFYGDYFSLLLELLNWPKPLLKEVLKELAQKKNERLQMSILSALPKFEEIAEMLEIDSKILFDKFSVQYDGNEINIENISNVIPTSSLFEKIIEIDNDLSKLIVKIGREYLDKISEKEWEDNFLNSESYIFRLLQLFLVTNVFEILPSNAVGAYKKALIKISKNEKFAIQNNEFWGILYEKCEKRLILSTIKDIRDNFINTGNIVNDQFLFFEKMLRENGNLMERSGDVIRRIFTPLDFTQGINRIILSNAIFYEKIIATASDDSIALLEKIRNYVELNSNETELISFENKIAQHISGHIKITHSIYYSSLKPEEERVNVTDIIKQLVERDGQFHFQVTNQLTPGKDIHEFVEKKLDIEYEINDKKESKTYGENSWVRLP